MFFPPNDVEAKCVLVGLPSREEAVRRSAFCVLKHGEPRCSVLKSPLNVLIVTYHLYGPPTMYRTYCSPM